MRSRDDRPILTRMPDRPAQLCDPRHARLTLRGMSDLSAARPVRGNETGNIRHQNSNVAPSS